MFIAAATQDLNFKTQFTYDWKQASEAVKIQEKHLTQSNIDSPCSRR
jgi:hypothetical protein